MRRIAVIVLLASLLSGCGSPKPSIVGTWTLTVGDFHNVVVNFKDDNSMDMEGVYQDFKVSATGTYALNETVLTLTPLKFDAKDVSEVMKNLLLPAAKKKFPPVNVTIEWVSKDEIRVTPPAGGNSILNTPFVMRRQVSPS